MATPAPEMYPVHLYNVTADVEDPQTNTVHTLDGDFHTHLHHDDHGGMHTQSWHDWVHDIMWPKIKAVLGGNTHGFIVRYRDFDYARKIMAPQLIKAGTVIYQAIRRRSGP